MSSIDVLAKADEISPLNKSSDWPQ
jgi:hypothetical protein